MKLAGKYLRWLRTHPRLTLSIALLTLVAFAAWFVYPTSSSLSVDSQSSPGDWTLAPASQNLALMAQSVAPLGAQSKRVIYPYSIIPGGVQSAEDLRKASQKDGLVAGHFAGFDYGRARVVPVVEPKLVYLSYRMKGRVYWTKKKVALHKGEYLLTDGHISARTRCANRVSEVAKPEVSREEPPASVFEQPMGDGDGTAMQVPTNFASALLNRPGLEALGPAPPPTGASGYAGGASGFYPGILSPGIPSAGCETDAQEQQEKDAGIKDDESKETHCPKGPPKPPPPGPPGPPGPPPPATVPEPGTIVLMASGLAGIYWRYRKHKG